MMSSYTNLSITQLIKYVPFTKRSEVRISSSHVVELKRKMKRLLDSVKAIFMATSFWYYFLFSKGCFLWCFVESYLSILWLDARILWAGVSRSTSSSSPFTESVSIFFHDVGHIYPFSPLLIDIDTLHWMLVVEDIS